MGASSPCPFCLLLVPTTLGTPAEGFHGQLLLGPDPCRTPFPSPSCTLLGCPGFTQQPREHRAGTPETPGSQGGPGLCPALSPGSLFPLLDDPSPQPLPAEEKPLPLGALPPRPPMLVLWEGRVPLSYGLSTTWWPGLPYPTSSRALTPVSILASQRPVSREKGISSLEPGAELRFAFPKDSPPAPSCLCCLIPGAAQSRSLERCTQRVTAALPLHPGAGPGESTGPPSQPPLATCGG